MTGKFLTVDQAAEFLQWNPWHIREFVRRGLLPREYGEINNRIHLVFRKQTLVEFINQGKERGQMAERPITAKEAAEFLNVNRGQIYYYTRLGLLRAYKLGNGISKKGSKRRWRIWKKDLIAFVNRVSNIKES